MLYDDLFALFDIVSGVASSSSFSLPSNPDFDFSKKYFVLDRKLMLKTLQYRTNLGYSSTPGTVCLPEPNPYPNLNLLFSF